MQHFLFYIHFTEFGMIVHLKCQQIQSHTEMAFESAEAAETKRYLKIKTIDVNGKPSLGTPFNERRIGTRKKNVVTWNWASGIKFFSI